VSRTGPEKIGASVNVGRHGARAEDGAWASRMGVMPRNPSGKILRKDLREPYWAGKDRRVG